MRTFTEQDIDLLTKAGIKLGEPLAVDSAYAPQREQVRAGFLGDGTPVHVLLIELGTGTIAQELRAYWYEIIQRTSVLYEPGMQRLLRSVDLGDACAFVVAPTVPFAQFLRSRAGTIQSVIQALRGFGLAMLGLLGQGLATTDLRLLNARVTEEGTAQLSFTTELSVITDQNQAPSALTVGQRRYGPVTQLLRLVHDLHAQQVISTADHAVLETIFDRVLEQSQGDDNLGDLLLALNGHLDTNRPAVADIVRKQSRPRLSSVATPFRLLAVAGAALLAVSTYLVVETKPWSSQTDQQLAGAGQAWESPRFQAQEVAPNRQEELAQTATSLVSERFALIGKVSKQEQDISAVGQVAAPDSPAHEQLTSLLTGLLAERTEVDVEAAQVKTTEVISDQGSAAVIRLSYELHQTQVREGTNLGEQTLTEEIDLSIAQLPQGWRITAASVVSQ